MKTCLVLITVIIFQACNLMDSDLDKNFSILTEKSSYTIQNQFSSKTIFTNNLDEIVKIHNSSCGGPRVSLEKYEDTEWVIAIEQPICDRAVSEPITLSNRKQIEIDVNIEVYDNTLSGLYRMKFKITNSDNTPLEAKYLISNEFQVVKQ